MGTDFVDIKSLFTDVDWSSFFDLTLFLEYYMSTIVDLIVLISLFLRYCKIEMAGHKAQKRFPPQIKIKFQLLTLWIIVTIAETVMIIGSIFYNGIWLA